MPTNVIYTNKAAYPSFGQEKSVWIFHLSSNSNTNTNETMRGFGNTVAMKWWNGTFHSTYVQSFRSRHIASRRCINSRLAKRSRCLENSAHPISIDTFAPSHNCCDLIQIMINRDPDHVISKDSSIEYCTFSKNKLPDKLNEAQKFKIARNSKLRLVGWYLGLQE